MSAPRALVPRANLVAELRDSLEARALTAIVAPAGYGKTSLIGLALDDPGRRAVYTAQLWHAGDFTGPLVREVRRLRPDFGRITLAIAARPPAAEDVAKRKAWAQRLGAAFAEELGHVDERITVVFDDVHLLADDASFAEFVVGAMRVLPEHVRLLLAGRNLPHVNLAEWLAQERAVVFGVEQLRFDESEIAALAERRGHFIDDARAASLYATFEGWPAGIALQFASGEKGVPAPGGALAASTALLLEANIDALESEVATFLEASAAFETLQASILEQDPSLGNVRTHLRDLERHGVMVSVVKPGESFRLHPLLRDALLDRIRLREGVAAIRARHRWAGELLERAGADVPALFHFEQSGDDARLAQFVRDHAYQLFIAGLGERAGRIVRGFAQRGFEAPIVSGLVEGMLLRQRGDSGAAERLSAALEVARAERDHAAQGALRFVLVEDRLARREAIPAGETGEILAIGRALGAQSEAVAYGFAGWSATLSGDFAAARAGARAALLRCADDLVGRARIAPLDAYVSTCLGEFEAADALMSDTLRELESSDHIVLLANTLVWYARFALLWGDTAAAKDYATKGRALAKRLELPAESAGLDLSLAEVFAHEGDVARCVRAAADASALGGSAWYAADRERAPALAALYFARAQFAQNGAAAGLRAATDALEATAPPRAQRISLLSEAAAYALVAREAEAANFAAQAAAELAAAMPSDALDALDALAMFGARGLLLRLEPAQARLAAAPVKGNAIAFAPALPAAVVATYAGLLERRADLQLSDRALLNGRGPRFESALLDALEPGTGAHSAPKSLEPRGSSLTKRELEILEFLSEGLTNKEIAQRFSLSPRTVDTHVERVLSKLGATTRTRAVAAAIRAGIVTPS